LTYFVLFIVVCAVWLGRVRYQLHGFRCVCRVVRGPARSELLQRTYLEASSADEFPQPREMRAIAIRLGGCALGFRLAGVNLPLQCDARIDAIDPTEFDHHFRGDFRLDAWQQTVPRWPVASAH
jgi:hypothetical protein